MKSQREKPAYQQAIEQRAAELGVRPEDLTGDDAGPSQVSDECLDPWEIRELVCGTGEISEQRRNHWDRCPDCQALVGAASLTPEAEERLLQDVRHLAEVASASPGFRAAFALGSHLRDIEILALALDVATPRGWAWFRNQPRSALPEELYDEAASSFNMWLNDEVPLTEVDVRYARHILAWLEPHSDRVPALESRLRERLADATP